MPIDPSQLTVLVKKPDGTMVRMKLSELNAQKPASAPVSPAPSAPGPAAPLAPAAPVAAPASKPLAKMPEPVKMPPSRKDASKPAPKMSRDDSRSLLDEKLPVKDDAPLASPGRENQIDAIVKKINFPVPADFSSRLRSIIQLRLKDLRTADETRETLLRAIKDGGLGLTENQAGKIITLCDEALSGDAEKNKEAKIEPLVGPKKKAPAPPMAAEPEKKMPAAAPASVNEMPAVSTPFNSFVHGENKFMQPKPAPAAYSRPESPKSNVVAKIMKEDMEPEPVFKINSEPAAKKVIQDIQAPPIEMGPVDEIKYMTLTDFRRLSDKPAEAAKRLKQKLTNLRDESFLLYMDAVNAYHSSPLYAGYMQAVLGSISGRRTLAAVLAGEKEQIKLTEIEALVEMEKEL